MSMTREQMDQLINEHLASRRQTTWTESSEP
jgi:hypothetical protein